MKCKSCGKEFHYCTSCDYDMYMMTGYCNASCYMESEEWKVFAPKIRNFWVSLSTDQQSELWSLWDNGILTDEKWEFMIDMEFENPYGNSNEPSTGD